METEIECHNYKINVSELTTVTLNTSWLYKRLSSHWKHLIHT